MSVQESEKPTTIVPFSPKKADSDSPVVDESGRCIIALLERAADMAKSDCARAMDLAHKLTFQLRAAETRVQKLEAESANFWAAEARVQELEAELAHFRNRATRAEDWLQRIHSEVEQTFFQKKEGNARPARLGERK